PPSAPVTHALLLSIVVTCRRTSLSSGPHTCIQPASLPDPTAPGQGKKHRLSASLAPPWHPVDYRPASHSQSCLPSEPLLRARAQTLAAFLPSSTCEGCEVVSSERSESCRRVKLCLSRLWRIRCPISRFSSCSFV